LNADHGKKGKKGDANIAKSEASAPNKSGGGVFWFRNLSKIGREPY